MVGHYDKHLIAIPLAMALGAASSVHPAVALHQGLGAGSLVGTLVLLNALFRNPPVEPTSGSVAASVIIGLGWGLSIGAPVCSLPL